MSDMDKKDTYIVIFLADLHDPPKSTTKAGISKTFGKYIDQGLLKVIEAYSEYYPPLTNIKNRGKKINGDSESRRTWRSKENVDVGYVMCYCRNLSHYYIHLEDDVISSPSFFPKLQDYLKSQSNKPWAMLDLTIRGSKAKGFYSQDLENIASYLYRKYDESPVDLLMISWRKIKDQKQRRTPPASLFQHIGEQSSLQEKGLIGLGRMQVEPYFDQYDQKYKGLNPPASVTSSLSSYQGKPQDAYEKGDGYFWAKNPRKGDEILIKFNIPTAVRTVFVDTGCNTEGHDILKSGVLQVIFESAKDNIQTKSNSSCGTFETLGTFKTRKVNISLDESKKVICLRILVTNDQSEFIYLREIDVW